MSSDEGALRYDDAPRRRHSEMPFVGRDAHFSGHKLPARDPHPNIKRREAVQPLDQSRREAGCDVLHEQDRHRQTRRKRPEDRGERSGTAARGAKGAFLDVALAGALLTTIAVVVDLVSGAGVELAVLGLALLTYGAYFAGAVRAGVSPIAYLRNVRRRGSLP